MENKKNNFKFTFAWSFSLFLLLTLVVLGVSSSVKGTKAAVSMACPSGYVESTSLLCCPSGYDYLVDGFCYRVNMDNFSYSATDNICISKNSNSSVGNCRKIAEPKVECVVDADGNCVSGSTQQNKCWKCNSDGYLYWGLNGMASGRTCGNGWTQVALAESQCSGYSGSSSTQQNKCWKCNSDGYLYWGLNGMASGRTCGNGWTQVALAESQCSGYSGSSSSSSSQQNKCWKCNSDGYYYWGLNGMASGRTCGNGWTQVALAESQCVNATGTCYLNSATGLYEWGNPTGTHQVVAVETSTQCYALNNVTATFYKGSTKHAVKTCMLLSKNGAAFPCTVTDPALPSGYSYWSSSSSCSDSVSTFTVPKGGASYYACARNYDVDPDPSSSSSSSSSSTSKPTSNPTGNPAPTLEPTSDKNVEENPPTSEIAIFVVWVVAAMAIVYSLWYFKKVREN